MYQFIEYFDGKQMYGKLAQYMGCLNQTCLMISFENS